MFFARKYDAAERDAAERRPATQDYQLPKIKFYNVCVLIVVFMRLIAKLIFGTRLYHVTKTHKRV